MVAVVQQRGYLRLGVGHQLGGYSRDIDRRDVGEPHQPLSGRGVGDADQVVLVEEAARLALGFQDADDGEGDAPDADDPADNLFVLFEKVALDLDPDDGHFGVALDLILDHGFAPSA